MELPCQYIELTAKEKEVIAYYIIDGTKRNFFPNDMGVVMISIGKNSAGKKRWYLQTQIDDRYKDSPPNKWTVIWNHVILISDEKVISPSKDTIEIRDRILCLEEVVRGHVYKRIQENGKLTVMVDSTGKVIREKDGRPKMIKMRKNIVGGNSYNELIIEFNEDGTIEKKIPV